MIEVFISWSGNTGNAIALKFREHLCSFLDLKVFMSDQDLTKGKQWLDELHEKLKSTNYGLFIITKDTVNSEWMAFEAGAINLNGQSIHVTPLLFGVPSSDMPKYLSNLQFCQFDEKDFKKVFHQLDSLSEKKFQTNTSTHVLTHSGEYFRKTLKKY